MKHLLKYRWEYCLLLCMLAMGIIVFDMKYLGHPYGTTFQWIVAFSYVAIFLFIQWGFERQEESEPVAPTEIPEEKEFIFIWYKKMVNGNTTHYTQPFRVKMKARSHDEAVAKVERIALQRMKLIIVDEENFQKDHLGVLRNSFKDLNKIFDKFNM